MGMVFCLDCNFPFELTDQNFNDYFSNQKVSCPKCHKEASAWKLVKSALDKDWFFDGIFSFIGAQRSILNVNIFENQAIELKFENYGIPKGAKILYLNYTPQGGGLFAFEMHGNTPHRTIPQEQVTLYPTRLPGEASSTQPGLLGIFVSWVMVGDESERSYVSLVQALEDSHAKDYGSAVIAANTAMELEVMRYVEDQISAVTSKNNKNEFMKLSTYIPSLKTLLPLITRLKGMANLPEEVRLALIDLASKRNQIAHTGTTSQALNAKEMSRMLCGVIFGVRYMKLIQS